MKPGGNAVASCRACEHPLDGRRHAVREMMIGLRESFAYSECPDCGTLHLIDLPADWSRYYGEVYYSFNVPTEITRSPLKRYLKSRALKQFLGYRNPVGMVMARSVRPPNFLPWLKRTGILQHHEILDVGCGSGAFLAYLRGFGFRRLFGCDPYIAADIDLDSDVRIRKCGLEEVTGRYDLITMHHSLEHMPDPGSALAQSRSLLKPHGWLLVRVPVADSYAWQEYGVNWVQLDAPRHQTIFTRRGLGLLAGAVGLQLRDVVDDSTELQFWGSEQYAHDIPLTARNSWLKSPDTSIFSPEQMAEYSRRARLLNEEGRGDQACFYFQADNPS